MYSWALIEDDPPSSRPRGQYIRRPSACFCSTVVVVPVVLGLEQVRERRRDGDLVDPPVVPARLQDEDRVAGLGEPVREHAPGAARPDHDVVVGGCGAGRAGGGSVHRRTLACPGASGHRSVQRRLRRPAHRPPADRGPAGPGQGRRVGVGARRRPRVQAAELDEPAVHPAHRGPRRRRASSGRSPTRRASSCSITVEEVLHDSTHELGVDPGLVKDGVEAHLQELLADQVERLGTGWRLVRREYPTPIGPVDLLCRDADGGAVAVEIKRRGEIDGVEQLTRYLDLLNRDPLLAPVRGVLAAQEIKPQARVLAARPRHRLRDARLRRAARRGRHGVPALLSGRSTRGLWQAGASCPARTVPTRSRCAACARRTARSRRSRASTSRCAPARSSPCSGPNGAGKTTTVEILEGYRDRTGGEVSVLGQDPGQADQRRGGPGSASSCSRRATTPTCRSTRWSGTSRRSTRPRGTRTRSSRPSA